MAPLADAMRLIHGDQRAVDAPEHWQRGARGEPFGCHVQEFQPPLIQRCEHLFGFFLGVPRGERPRLNPRGAQRPDLIAHQRNQRRDNHRHPISAQRRKLKTQGFSATRWHDGQRVAPGQHGIHNLFLSGPKARKAKDRMQKRCGVGGHGR